MELLTSLALQNEKVVAVKSFEMENARVFSVLTVPIYLKSEREDLKSTLVFTLSQGKPAYVSFDNDVYRNIKPDMTDEQKQKLLDTIIERENR